MKKGILLMLFLFVIPLVSAASYEANYTVAGGYKFPDISILNLRYEPYPVNPGEYFDLWIKAENLARDLTNDATFKLMPEYPFSLESGVSPIQSVGKINYDQPVVVKYRIKVSEDAVDGNNELKLAYNIAGSEDIWAYKTFNIDVADAQTDFDLVIQEAEEQTVSIAIANTGKNIAHSVIVKVPEQQNFETIGTSGQMVGNLENGDYTMVSFDIKPKSRTAGKKQLQIQIDYTDNIGERRSLIKQIIYEAGRMSTTNGAVDHAAMGAQFAGRNGMRMFQQKEIYQEWWFWAIVVAVLFVGWKAFNKVKDRKKR